MKRYSGIIVLALMVLVFSCKKDDVPACLDCGKRVKKIKNSPGYVIFDSATKSYLISMYVPGSIDSRMVGYVCDLPTEFANTGKQVTVSGTLFKTSRRYRSPICCIDENYCLTLSSIKEQ